MRGGVDREGLPVVPPGSVGMAETLDTSMPGVGALASGTGTENPTDDMDDADDGIACSAFARHRGQSQRALRELARDTGMCGCEEWVL